MAGSGNTPRERPVPRPRRTERDSLEVDALLTSLSPAPKHMARRAGHRTRRMRRRPGQLLQVVSVGVVYAVALVAGLLIGLL